MQRSSCAAGILAIVTLVGSADGDVLFDTIGGGTANTTWLIGDFDLLNANEASHARRLQLAGAGPYDIETITVRLGYGFGAHPGFASNVNVEIHTDGPGGPDTLIASTTVFVDQPWSTGPALYDASFSGVTLAAATDYWIAVTPAVTDNTVVWQFTDTGLTGTSAFREELTGFLWAFHPGPTTYPAMRIDGTTVSTCAADITGPKGPGSGDGNVDALDFLLLNSQWGSPCTIGGCEGDFTGAVPFVPDGNVDALDFLLLNAQFGSPGNCP